MHASRPSYYYNYPSQEMLFYNSYDYFRPTNGYSPLLSSTSRSSYRQGAAPPSPQLPMPQEENQQMSFVAEKEEEEKEEDQEEEEEDKSFLIPRNAVILPSSSSMREIVIPALIGVVQEGNGQQSSHRLPISLRGATGKYQIQWLRSEGDHLLRKDESMAYLPISGATSASYTATADDLHAKLCVQLTDNSASPSSSSRTITVPVPQHFLVIDPVIDKQVHTLVKAKKCIFTLMWTDSAGRDTEVDLCLDQRSIKLKQNNKTIGKARLHSNVRCHLLDTSPADVVVEFSEKTKYNLHTTADKTGHYRDVLVLTIRSYVAKYVLSKDITNSHIVRPLASLQDEIK